MFVGVLGIKNTCSMVWVLDVWFDLSEFVCWGFVVVLFRVGFFFGGGRGLREVVTLLVICRCSDSSLS